MSDETELVATVEVHTRLVPGEDPFYQPDTIKRLEAASIEAWRNMEDDERKALVVVMRDAMVHMMVDPEVWLPGSLVLESDQRIQVVLTFQTGKIHETVATMRRRHEQHMIEMRDDVVSMRRDLERGN